MVGSAWLFFSGNRYYVTHGFDDDLCDLSFNAIPVDELIAEPVMMLCNKGYITEYSCSAHPFNECHYETIESNNTPIDENDHAFVKYDSDEGVAVLCDIDSSIGGEMYISFCEEQNFPTLPNGWSYSRKALRANAIADTVVGFYKNAIQLIESLTIWIDSLPKKK